MVVKCLTNCIINNLKENADIFEPLTYLPVLFGITITIIKLLSSTEEDNSAHSKSDIFIT